ncbi:hypothetical protein E1A91_D03G095400v1 [Gossypium mustelinum]|uniref:Large ribosomal subunit protein uL6 N-terminal domain-containing protein n=1 Tax=Gossypium mustelinum TaxID=34275 RepID=A0A5D2VKR1_GOSMU|nr:hypothetical protein E1A91_D03G095400v1 [Gossypium mustelinum]
MAAKRKTPVKTRNPDLIRGVGKYSRSKKPLLNKRKPKPTKLRFKGNPFNFFFPFTLSSTTRSTSGGIFPAFRPIVTGAGS